MKGTNSMRWRPFSYNASGRRLLVATSTRPRSQSRPNKRARMTASATSVTKNSSSARTCVWTSVRSDFRSQSPYCSGFCSSFLPAVGEAAALVKMVAKWPWRTHMQHCLIQRTAWQPRDGVKHLDIIGNVVRDAR